MINETMLKKWRRICKEFGKKYFEHYGLKKRDDVCLYVKEYRYYKKHNKLSKEV